MTLYVKFTLRNLILTSLICLIYIYMRGAIIWQYYESQNIVDIFLRKRNYTDIILTVQGTEFITIKTLCSFACIIVICFKLVKAQLTGTQNPINKTK